MYVSMMQSQESCSGDPLPDVLKMSDVSCQRGECVCETTDEQIDKMSLKCSEGGLV